jgi:DNA-binding NarL/FixJ family response regulator
VSERLRLLIVDREATQAGIRLALSDQVDVCACATDAETAIRAAKREQPDLCLVAADLPGGGLAAVQRICRAAPRSAVVVLALDDNVEDLLDAIRAGAVGYVPGPLNAERLRQIVRAIAANEAVVPRAMVLELLLEVRNIGAGGRLSNRESQVLGMLRRGHSTAEIAARLEIVPVTVRRHISGLVRKLGVADRSDLLVTPGQTAQPVLNPTVQAS